MTSVRPATLHDVPVLVALSEQSRTRLAAYQPTFWRKAPNAAAAQTPYLEALVADPNAIARVVEEAGTVTGFVIAVLRTAPPVYDPGGPSCEIDDFVVVPPTPERWLTLGKVLLAAVLTEARARQAAQMVVVCPEHDAGKRRLLRDAGLTIATEWYTAPLDDVSL